MLKYLFKAYSSYRRRWSLFYREHFEKLFKDVKLPEFTSAGDVADYMNYHFTWEQDGFKFLGDVISYPGRILVEGRNDCDNFAAFAAEICKEWGKPILLTLYMDPIRNSHTVCVYKNEGSYICFDNDDLFRRTTLHAVFDRIQGKNKLYFWDALTPKLKFIDRGYEVSTKLTKLIEYMEG